MATGRERRAERLNERLRGAQRHNVDDDSFNLDIGGFDNPTLPAASIVRSPQLPNKNRRLDKDGISIITGPSSRPARQAKNSDPYDLPDSSKESIGQPTRKRPRNQLASTPLGNSSTAPLQNKSAKRPLVADKGDEEIDELDDVAIPSSARLPPTVRSPDATRTSTIGQDEVEESPAHAPGSGRRRNAGIDSVASSSARLRDVLGTDDASTSLSSPTVMRAWRSDASAATRRSTRSVVGANVPTEEVDELSPDRPRQSANNDAKKASEEVLIEESDPEAALEAEQLVEDDGEGDDASPSDETPPNEAVSDEELAEEIGVVEASRALGRKRPRRSSSPVLGSDGGEDDSVDPVEEPEDEQPVPKRKRGRPSKSPASQKRPIPKSRLQNAGQDPTHKKRGRKPKDPNAPERPRNADSEGNTIEITVQRFANNRRRDGEDADADPLQTEIPFANGSGASAVDVFAQVCEEVIAATLEQFEELGSAAEDPAKRKECRVKMRAIEAYREELSSRLLQHAIHLDHWHSLRKRVRFAQKEKLSLREDIIRLKQEREQVALRMDAIRVKHETDDKDSKYRLKASSLMHDIDLAVEQGRDSSELSQKAQKRADLANLELQIAQVVEEATTSSFTGGMLKQVRDFNAFLERAATALESR